MATCAVPRGVSFFRPNKRHIWESSFSHKRPTYKIVIFSTGRLRKWQHALVTGVISIGSSHQFQISAADTVSDVSATFIFVCTNAGAGSSSNHVCPRPRRPCQRIPFEKVDGFRNGLFPSLLLIKVLKVAWTFELVIGHYLEFGKIAKQTVEFILL